jgi:hypothetical protein
MSLSTARNIAIILILALLVVLVPGGGTGSSVAIQVVSLIFLATLVWFAALMYRQRRDWLYGLGDRRRAILYAALAVGTLTLTATPRLWQSGVGSVVWLVLVAAAAYAVIAVVWAARRY